MRGIKVIEIRELDEDIFENFRCRHNNSALESYLKENARNDSDENKLYTRTHVVFEEEDNTIVGFFTISFKTFKFHRTKKDEMGIRSLHNNEGEYNTIYLHFFGLDDAYKGKYIRGSDVKYSNFLMFLFLSVCYEIYLNIPFAGITLYSYEQTKYFYEEYDFTYIQRDNTHKNLYLYMLPAPRIPLHLSENEEGYFLDLIKLMDLSD